MLCISTVSARATGEIKSTWLGDVALIPGGGERWREGEEEGEKGKKRKEKKRVEKEEGKRRKKRDRNKLRSRRLQCLLAISLVGQGSFPSLESPQVSTACKEGNHVFQQSFGKNPSTLTSLIERLGHLQHLLHKKSGEVPGHQVKVPRHKSRRPEARPMTLM